jgi:hypothetical protein
VTAIVLALSFFALRYHVLSPHAEKPTLQSSRPSDDAATNRDAHAKMKARGEQAMGFSQTATTHHFLLKPDGGAIQVEANDSADTVSRDQIRMHLTHIAHAFAAGDFDIPMLVHDEVPSGVPDMKRLKDKIRYSFEQTSSGGRVIIHASNHEALAAIHNFLRFQIREHKTGDSLQLK